MLPNIFLTGAEGLPARPVRQSEHTVVKVDDVDNQIMLCFLVMLYSTFTFFLDICIYMILLLYLSTYVCAKHANFILHQNRTSNDSNLDRLLLCLLCSHYRVNIRLL